MPIYEAGYHINSCFQHGAMDAGGGQLNIHVIPHDKREPKKMELDVVFERLKKDPPPYVHAIFAGTLGNEFLLEWKNSGLHNQIPLIVVENMAYDDVLSDVGHLDLNLTTASTWSRTDENPRNSEFVKRFEKTGGQQANIFGLLGYEAGLALKEVKSLIQKRDNDKVASLLQKEAIVGPRGERNFYPASGYALPTTDIVNVKTSANNIYKTILSQGKGLKFDDEQFKAIHEGSVSGWLNPYLCI